jgi:hypothetical protein
MRDLKPKTVNLDKRNKAFIEDLTYELRLKSFSETLNEILRVSQLNPQKTDIITVIRKANNKKERPKLSEKTRIEETLESISRFFETLEDYETNIHKADMRYNPSNFVEATYQDCYDKETIYVEIEEDQKNHGVIKYSLEIKTLDLQEEIQSSQSCHDCQEECSHYVKETQDKEAYCDITETEITQEIEDWKRKGLFQKPRLTIKTIVEEEECSLNVTHYHLVKGFQISLETYDSTELKTIIHVRDLLLDIFKKALK